MGDNSKLILTRSCLEFNREQNKEVSQFCPLMCILFGFWKETDDKKFDWKIFLVFYSGMQIQRLTSFDHQMLESFLLNICLDFKGQSWTS